MKKDKRSARQEIPKKEFDKEAWKPKTEIGKKVKSGEIKTIDEILGKGSRILESEIVDALLPDLETYLIEIGQSKGKFGGGKRSIWRQTQKKTREGNKPKFSTMIVIGHNGYIGIGRGKAKETMPAREKALRQAKLNIIRIVRGCGSWESVPDNNSIPFKVTGTCGNAEITLIPAPKGVGLCIEEQCAQMLKIAGIKDIYSKTKGQTKKKINLISACFDALKKLSEIKALPQHEKSLGLVKGAIKNG